MRRPKGEMAIAFGEIYVGTFVSSCDISHSVRVFLGIEPLYRSDLNIRESRGEHWALKRSNLLAVYGQFGYTHHLLNLWQDQATRRHRAGYVRTA